MARTVSLRALRGVLAPVALLLMTAAPSGAYDVVEVEEHWALTVGGPDTLRSAPQVSMVMSATGDANSDFFLVTLNHWSYPQFASGGVQAQRWCGDECVDTANASTTHPLDTEGDTIRWVQRMRLSDCHLEFEVIGGQSESWGAFASDDSNELRLTSYTELARLNGYLPAVSLTQSGIGFAGNRVSGLVLERITWKDSEGEQYEMVAPIDIDADLDP